MYTVELNGKKNKVELERKGSSFKASINDKALEGSLVKINDWQFHLIYNEKSYNVDVIKLNKEEKTITLKINSARFTLQLKDKYDELLTKLGMDTNRSRKVSEIKAPMPGMVLKVLVEEGVEVKKGDALIVLEAMKMENILKSPSDGVVKKIVANKGRAVEKNEVLIQF